jgi:hypothetical protein
MLTLSLSPAVYRTPRRRPPGAAVIRLALLFGAWRTSSLRREGRWAAGAMEALAASAVEALAALASRGGTGAGGDGRWWPWRRATAAAGGGDLGGGTGGDGERIERA